MGELVQALPAERNSFNHISVAKAEFYLSKAKNADYLVRNSLVGDLRHLCSQFQLQTTGTHAILVERLVEYYVGIILLVLKYLNMYVVTCVETFQEGQRECSKSEGKRRRRDSRQRSTAADQDGYGVYSHSELGKGPPKELRNRVAWQDWS